ncbi:hypothetical protein CBR_g28861 [Chara braunii]|uniref:Retrotransposon gag domain-containing protein n=1 Tax=Chara braunii TaxID=69332 RepID=A0A388LA35_CHABU|nr:hypothetical protein CBR_g28861 [Chara braunii]|eukprot:GBG79146.1 hypothetical protein CBR_g28861 [Chara braunii]
MGRGKYPKPDDVGIGEGEVASRGGSRDEQRGQRSRDGERQVSQRVARAAELFKRLGVIGFWSQLVCTFVSAGILAFSLVLTGKATSVLTLYLTAAGICAAFLSVFWSFGYTRLSLRLREGVGNPSKVNLRDGEGDLQAAETSVQMMETGQRVEELIKQGRLVLDRYVAESLEKLDQERTKRTGKKEEVVKKSGRISETNKQQQEEERVMEMLREKFHYEEIGSEVASILQSIMVYLVNLEKKIDHDTITIESLTRMVKGKDEVLIEEVAKGGEDKKEPREKLMKDAMKGVTPEKAEGSKKEPEKPEEKKEEPTGKKEELAKEAEKPKKKEKVKMKLPFTYSNKKDENLFLWIAEIQTYCSTAPVEPESQVAFSTSCLGGVAKEWVLAEANADGFEDIGEWAKTLTLRQFLQKIKERFLDKTTADKAFDELTTISQKRTSVDALSREVDCLL